MANLVKLAQKYIRAGYSVIPVGTNKIPTIPGWRDYQEKPMSENDAVKLFKNASGIALLGGVNNVTIVDHDLKNDLTGDYYKRLEAKVPQHILDKMYMQTTQNKGVHWVFRCPTVEPNQKLASRFTTADEKHRIYIENFENPITKERAFKIANNYNTLVVSETRGAGGYALIAPTPGYEWVRNKIGELTEDEYEELMDTIRSMDEIVKVRKPDSRQDSFGAQWKVSPFADANRRLDMNFLLESNGWSNSGGYGRNIRYKRPGRSSPSSALFDTETRLLSVFTTSSDLEPKAYTATDLFTHFECNGDIGLCYTKLVEMGYGQK